MSRVEVAGGWRGLRRHSGFRTSHLPLLLKLLPAGLTGFAVRQVTGDDQGFRAQRGDHPCRQLNKVGLLQIVQHAPAEEALGRARASAFMHAVMPSLLSHAFQAIRCLLLVADVWTPTDASATAERVAADYGCV